ncbi:MAG: 16S rRNA (cytosine(967)-C(5))-methyltransferase RsmB [Oscillospiraceae bacterium]|nr:16S rRNA (cytosine(967)-C(5))-methyltransferase RsmB [Oscillospiraceae bacterium]
MKTPRLAAYELLLKMENKAYSNLALNAALSGTAFKTGEKAFTARLFCGVTERKLTLDYIISLHSKKPPQKLDREILTILRMGLYQLLYMDSVPDSAAVNESVLLAKKAGKGSASGFVNAVLRGFIRGGKRYEVPEDKEAALGVEYSCPIPLLKALTADYGEENAVDLLSSSFGGRRLFIRANSVKITASELCVKFAENGIKAELHPAAENCLSADSLADIENNPLFKEGLFHIQDLSSQLCCAALSPKKGETVLDICAAPGGKSFTMAQMTAESNTAHRGVIYSCDINSKRVNLIKSGAQRLSLKNIKAYVNDARVFNSEFPSFDKILCDVPCSGFGAIGGKPEIKYKELSETEPLPQIQCEILSTAANYLKIGGELVYSTCTLLKRENDNVIDRFLEENPQFEGVEDLGITLPAPAAKQSGFKLSIFPQHFGSEGFFIAKIRRKLQSHG